MYFKSILPTVALFFFVASLANAAPKESQGPNHILARSPHLSLRQATGSYGDCTALCDPLDSKLDLCGLSEACACGPSVSGPLRDCAKCGYTLTTDTSLRAELMDAFNEYVDACKDAGHPIEGETTISGSASLPASSSSARSSASTLASAAASATAASSSDLNTKFVSNGAIGTISRSAAALAFPVGVVAVLGFMF